MKKLVFSLFVLCALGICMPSFAADKEKKKDDKKDMKDDTEDGPITLTGTMAVKGTDAKKDVVARIEGRKRYTWLNLIATGDLAAKIQKLREDGDKVKVTGKKTGDDVVVESITAVGNMKK